MPSRRCARSGNSSKGTTKQKGAGRPVVTRPAKPSTTGGGGASGGKKRP